MNKQKNINKNLLVTIFIISGIIYGMGFIFIK